MRRGLEGVLPQISQEDMPLGAWLPTSPMHREFNNNRNVVLRVCVCVCMCVRAYIPTYAQKQSKRNLENKAFLYFNPTTLD